MSIERKNQERVQRVNAETETTLSEAVEAVRARLNEINVPKDFAVGFGNEVEEQARSFNELRLVLILAIILVYTVMASHTNRCATPSSSSSRFRSPRLVWSGSCSSPGRRSACRPISA